MAININDFMNNAVFLNDNACFKIEENFCYVYPYGEKHDKQYYIFDFLDEKSISEKGIYRTYDIISNAIITEANKRFYTCIVDTGVRIENFSGSLNNH